ncbi:MAG: molybdopterin-synthase adenylyltransferase MoeB [Elusimicrobia bacterium]|nr:molybdopterin-synthase adenylyltransferase MoeB [Elusimicrobiota bacterium]
MSIQIQLPTALRPFAEQKETVELDADTVGSALEQLTSRHAQLRKHLIGDDGKLRNFVNVYVNDEDIRHLKGPATPVKPGDVLMIVPAIAGGSTGCEAAPASGTAPTELNAEEIKRYGRHLVLPEVGLEGQKKLKRAKVLTVGAGGLGSPLATYLAAAGVGTIGIVDFDKVEFSNLQRQILFSTDSVGKPKIAEAKARLNALNPNVRVVAHETRLSSQNALEIIKDYDVVADGTDNFPTRYLVNDACALAGKPNVYGSIFRFEGQVSVFYAKEGPCYRCLYPEPPPPGLVPDCATGGVLGVLPGIIGAMQAVEVIKVILGIGRPLIGHLALFDALKMEWRKLTLRKSQDCPLCGPKATIKTLIDYEAFCGVPPPSAAKAAAGIPEISVEDLKARIDRRDDFFLLDVREPHEFAIASIPGSTLIPLGQLPDRWKEIEPHKRREVLVHCKMGGRSAKAVKFLREQGFETATNVAGGINAWSERIDPAVPQY